MEANKEKGRKGLIIKTWERCKSIGRKGNNKSAPPSPLPSPRGPAQGRPNTLTRKSRSWSGSPAAADFSDGHTANKRRVAPEGCFSVYVGPTKQKFVIKTEYANHPLFGMLLEEAEAEYGYSSRGPIELPCDVAVFYRVLMEMDADDVDSDGGYSSGRKWVGCGFTKGYGGYRLLSPSRMVAINQF